MSTSRAIQAVTEKLLNRLMVADSGVTAKPLDKIGNSKLNLFLYHVATNAAWRNQDLPTPSTTGQPRRPLLPLNLYYLVSACEEDQKAHDKLGKAMLSFHDQPELREFNPNSGIKNQVDPIRITNQSLSLDEMSKLWSSFQAAYRPSIAYEVGVVLIESELELPSPLPVVRRGSDDLGWNATTQFPATLTSVRFQTKSQPGLRLGETLVLVGENLMQPGQLKVVFSHRALTDEIVLEPTQITNNELTVSIPDDANAWPAGVYTVRLRNKTTVAGEELLTHSQPIYMALTPEILVPPQGLKTRHHPFGRRSLPTPCKPRVKTNQIVYLLIGSTRIQTVDVSDPGEPVAAWNSSDLNLKDGETPYARLLVDGVESLLHDPTDPTQGINARFEVEDL